MKNSPNLLNEFDRQVDCHIILIINNDHLNCRVGIDFFNHNRDSSVHLWTDLLCNIPTYANIITIIKQKQLMKEAFSF